MSQATTHTPVNPPADLAGDPMANSQSSPARLDSLHHVGICTRDLERTRRFYVEVLGLQDGYRGRLRNPGAWLYLDGVPVVHIITGQQRPQGMTGHFDHFCMRASGYEAWKQRLDGLGVRYAEDHQEGGVRQLFLHDPNDVMVELNFAPPAA